MTGNANPARFTARISGNKFYHGWTIVAAMIFGQVAANGVALNGFSLFLKSWSEELHRPISMLQLAMLPLAVMTALTGPVIGALADRVQARWLMGGGLVGMGGFYLGISLMTSVWQYFLLYGLVLPIVLSLSTSVVANALVSRWFVRRLGLALGFTTFGVGFGGIVLPPIITAALPAIGWRGIWEVNAAILLALAAPALAMILRDRPTGAEGASYLTDISQPGRQESGSTLAWRDFLVNRNFWLIVGTFLMVLAPYSGCAYNLAQIAAKRELSLQNAAMLISLLGITHVASNLIFGLLSDRLGNRIPLIGLALVTALGTLLVGIATTTASMAMGVALVGLSGGIWPLITASFAVEFGGANVGRAFGLMLFVLPINALASVIVARVEETTGSYAPALIGFAIFAGVGSLLAAAIREVRPT